jgi:hypothetical protein
MGTSGSLTVVHVIFNRSSNCFGYLMSPILLIWFNHVCLCCVISFQLGLFKVKVKVKVKGKVAPVIFLTKHHAMKGCWVSGGIAPRIVDLGTRWRWVVSFTTRPLNPQGKNPWCPLYRRLGGPWTRWWREKFPTHAGTRTPNHPTCSPVLYHWARVRVNLLLKGSQSVSLGFEPLAGTLDHIYASERMLRCYASWGVLPDWWTGLSCRVTVLVCVLPLSYPASLVYI